MPAFSDFVKFHHVYIQFVKRTSWVCVHGHRHFLIHNTTYPNIIIMLRTHTSTTARSAFSTRNNGRTVCILGVLCKSMRIDFLVHHHHRHHHHPRIAYANLARRLRRRKRTKKKNNATEKSLIKNRSVRQSWTDRHRVEATQSIYIIL